MFDGLDEVKADVKIFAKAVVVLLGVIALVELVSLVISFNKK